MNELLPALALVMSFVGLVFLVLTWARVRRPAGDPLDETLREELRTARAETATQARELRAEVAAAQNGANELLVQTIARMGASQREWLDQLRTATEEKLRENVEVAERRGGELVQKIQELLDALRVEMGGQREKLETHFAAAGKDGAERFDRVRKTLDDKLRQVMEDQKKHLADVVAALKGLEKAQQEEQAKGREALDLKFRQIQESNERKLEEMRVTVDEKLHSTLEKRLGESFKLVSERLEAVQNGLGEMKNLATGVGDLKRVLTNVKERGTWGEYQLGAILEEILTPAQFARNVRPKEGGEVVEFAVRLPGRDRAEDAQVWLPIDAKFPKEDFERLSEAAARGDSDGVKEASRRLGAEIVRCAKDIQSKYISPPNTTDFAIMFLPTEGLYAEVLRQPGLHDELQRKHHVLAAGPTTLAAILNSLRIGFQTLVIEKRAHEVWSVLGAVKSEFGKFGDVLDKVKRQLNTAVGTLENTSARTRAMQRKLRSVEELPEGQSEAVLGLPSGPSPAGGEGEDTEDPS